MAAFDYTFTGRDFTARFEALIARLQSEVPELTDLNHSDAGISMLRLVADTTDKLNFYIDQAFNEGFIETAWFMQSLIDIAKTVDILPVLASPGRTTLTFTRRAGVTGTITVPQYSAFTRPDGYSYLTDAEAVIPSNHNTVSVNATQGTLVTYTLDPATDFTISTVTNRAMFNLGANVAARTISIQHGTPIAVPWIEIDGFWRSLATDYHFRLELYAEPVNGVYNTVNLILGDGAQGRQSPPSDMTVSFIRTDGPTGNCGSGVVTIVPPAFTEVIDCTNPTPATGGGFSEGIENFRRRIPAVVRTQRRGLTVTDYEALIGSIAGVKHVQAVDRNYGDQWPHMYVVLFVVPNGGGPMSDELQETITAQCSSWGHLGNWPGRYILLDATPVPTGVICRIGVSPGSVGSTVAANVQTAIRALFSVDNLDIGGTLTFTTLHQTASAVSGVAWVEFSSPTVDSTCGIGEILTAGTTSVSTA